jgi:general secretion pathway protein A
VYEAHFGFTSKPFQLVPDPDFFYGSRGHKRALAYLEYGLHQGEGFIVITGEVGAGKTTLVRNLLRRVPQQKIVAAQIVSTQLDAQELLRIVASSFGLDTDGLDKTQILGRLEALFRSLYNEGRRALLIVDEAQNLSAQAVEELRMLSNFQIEAHSLVQSFLVGQPEFREMMQRQEMRQLKQRIIASYHLGPLDESETRAYIEHRLTKVGWRENPRFQKGAIEAIHRLTDGVPRRINTICDRLLLAAFLGNSSEITASNAEEISGELNVELGINRDSQFAMHRGAGENDNSPLNAHSDSLTSIPPNSSVEASLARIAEALELMVRRQNSLG